MAQHDLPKSVMDHPMMSSIKKTPGSMEGLMLGMEGGGWVHYTIVITLLQVKRANSLIDLTGRMGLEISSSATVTVGIFDKAA